MSSFFSHPKFWLPLLLLLGLELVFRFGLWEPLAEPESHAGTSIALKQALQRFGTRKIQVIVLGDSRVQYGLDHASLSARARANGIVWVNMSLPGTHLATLRSLRAWANDRLPQLETVIIGMSPAALAQIGNGDYEIGIVEPFRAAGDYLTLLDHVPPRFGVPSSWGSVSSLASYREDIAGMLTNPKRRLQRLIARDLEDPRRRLQFSNPSFGNLCEFRLDSQASCVAELNRLREQGRADQAAAQSFANWCETEPAAVNADTRKLAHAAWRKSLEQLGQDYRLLVLLMPSHSLLQRAGLETDTALGLERVLKPMEDSGLLQIIDLRSVLSGTESIECENYRDLVHANRHGMHRLTRSLLDQLRP